MSTIMLSKQPVEAAAWIASGDWAWSRCRVMGTEAVLAAEAAALASAAEEYCWAQGKRRIMAGERLASAARTVARMPSMLYCGCEQAVGERCGERTYAADACYAVFSLRGFLEHDVGFVGAEVELGFL